MLEKKYDWVDRTLFLMFAYAHITDWELADSEREVIKSKTDFILKNIDGKEDHYSSDQIELKMEIAYRYWNELQNESVDDVLSELQKIAGEMKSESWFDHDFAKKMIGFLYEVARADGVVLDNEKFSIEDLSSLWELESTF